MATVNLEGRVALVTGASRGIGRATAIAMARSGAQVVVNYYDDPEVADQVVRTIRDAGGQAIAVQADVAVLEAVEAMVARAADEFGKLDILVSNAVYSDRDLFYLADLQGFHRTIDVAMWGGFHALRAAACQMIRQQTGGAMCVVSSPHAFIPVPRSMAYNMAKAALEQMARTAAIELAEHRIRVNIIQPGWTDTPGERKFFDEDALRKAGERIPLGRLGTPEDMAAAILQLVDPEQDYMTGATLLVDGGITLPWWSNRGSAVPTDD